MGYFSTAMIADYWAFMVSLSVLMVCTVYADVKYFKIASVLFLITTIVIITLRITTIKSDNPMYDVFKYIAILLIYIIFSITITRTSGIIQKVNAD